MDHFFPYAMDEHFKLFYLPFGLRPDRDGVRVTDDELIATYGRFRVVTPRSNVVGGHVTRDYRWWTAIGVRGSLADDGLTFGTNTRAGVCIHFADRVPKVIGLRDHSALTVTVADVDGLVAAIGEAAPPA
jgi:hypothetical protein